MDAKLVILINAIVIILTVCIGVVALAISAEKKVFNNGKCKCCGKYLELFDYDSMGGRGYVCHDCHNYIWISYNSVDKRYRSETLAMIHNKDCKVCKHRQKMSCPNTSLCMCTDDKPYFESK